MLLPVSRPPRAPYFSARAFYVGSALGRSTISGKLLFFSESSWKSGSSIMTEPFTIRVYVPDGDPDGVRIVDRLNWTGVGVVFPRELWQNVSKRAEFGRTGVYILQGYKEGDED